MYIKATVVWERIRGADVDGCQDCGHTHIYTPQPADLSAYLRVDCLVPGQEEEDENSVRIARAVTEHQVSLGPSLKAGHGRHDTTRTPLPRGALIKEP